MLGRAEAPMPTPHAISVYYPFALTDLVRYAEGDDYEQTGDVMLVLIDEEGCQVTVRMRSSLAERLASRLQSPPDPRDKP
jgi:hypothetical protein